MVIDASVLLRAFLPDDQQAQAQAVVRDFVAGRIGLLAPSLLPSGPLHSQRDRWQHERRLPPGE
jgi:hypothetical protein